VDETEWQRKTEVLQNSAKLQKQINIINKIEILYKNVWQAHREYWDKLISSTDSNIHRMAYKIIKDTKK
jgi:hypothetical protein